MNLVLDAINWFGKLPSPVMMFLIFFVLNLALRIRPSKALRAAFMYAMGLFVLSTFAFEVFLGAVVGVANAMIVNLGLKMTVVDFGTGIMPVFLQHPLIVWAIPIGLGLNIFMLLFKLTKTLDVDIWNILYFWGLSGVFTYVATGNLVYGVLSIILTGVITLKVADWSAPHIHKVLPQYEGISFPYVYSAFYAPVAYWFNKLFDKSAYIRNSNVSAETIREKFGILGEPGIIGFFLGITMAILGRYSFADVMMTGIKLGASLYFIPLSVKILIEGLTETTTVLTEWVKKRFNDRELYIGLDGVLLAGLPESLAVGLLFVPIALLVAIILPGNKVLPVGMLSVGFILVALFMPFFKMNILKGAIFCFFVAAGELYIGTLLAPVYTQMAIEAGYDIPYGAVQITNAGNFPVLLFYKLFEAVQAILGG